MLSLWVTLGAGRARAEDHGCSNLPVVVNTDPELRVDGRLDDPAWQHASSHCAFVERTPHESRTATDATEVRLLTDKRSLCFAIRLWDRMADHIVERLTRRDESSTADWVHLFVVTRPSTTLGYRFSVNAAGVKQDARLSNGGEEDLGFDAVWDAATHRDPHGWSAELCLPFQELDLDSGTPHLRLQIGRIVARRGEESYLVLYPKSATRPLDHTVPITGLPRLSLPVHATLLPYLSGSVSADGPARQATLKSGADLELSLSPEVALSLTVHPDFGQVEADPSNLNLTAFETHLPEKRPFFLAGRENLDTGLRFGTSNDVLFYSRRIGQLPRVSLPVGPEQILRLPSESTILFATKLIGRTRDGLTLGLLSALTDQETAEIRTSTGQTRVRVAPRTELGVARITKELDRGRTVVGATVTGLSRALGTELAPSLPRSAHTFGLEFQRREGSVELFSRGFFSMLQGSPESLASVQRSSAHYFQRPDASHLCFDPNRRSLTGWGATLVGAKSEGRPLRASWGGTVISPEFEPNDLGYLQKADEVSFFAKLALLDENEGALHRRRQVELSGNQSFTFGGESQGRYAVLTVENQFRDLTRLTLSVERHAERMDPRALRGGPALRVPGKYASTIGLYSDDSRSLATDLSVFGGRNDGNAAHWLGGQFQLRARPFSLLQLSLGGFYQRTLDGWAYLSTDDSGRTLVGELPRDTLNATLRGSLALSPELTCELYTMPYLSRGRYRRFLWVTDPDSRNYTDHFTVADPPESTGFSFAEWRQTVVLRWEFDPGSTAYLVYSREQTRSVDRPESLRPARNLERLLASPSRDTVMLKVSAWLPY